MNIELFSQEQVCDFFGPDDYASYLERYQDHKSRLKYFGLDSGIWHTTEEKFIVAIEGDKIIGVFLYVVVNHPQIGDHKHYISYISVDPQYRNQGIAKALIEFWTANVVNLELGECGCSGYTQNGFDYLKPILESLPFAVQKRQKEF